jgi:hypothetical protein
MRYRRLWNALERKMKKLIVSQIALLFSALIFGCQARQASEAKIVVADSNSSDRSFGTGLPLWSKKRLGVCWEIGSVFSSDQKIMIEEAVAKEYAQAEFELYNWKECSPKQIVLDSSSPLGVTYIPNVDEDIRVDSCDNTSNPNTSDNPCENYSALGADNLTLFGGVHLNQKADTTGLCSDRKDGFCLKNYALHEFGHALGLSHEHEGVNPDNCPEIGTVEAEFQKGKTTFGTIDKDSIMNYCKNIHDMVNGQEPKLSTGDISGLIALYNEPIITFSGPSAEDADQIISTLQVNTISSTSGLNQSTDYRYKIVEASVDCKVDANYSNWRSIQTPIVDDLRNFAPEQLVILCAQGRRGDSMQSLERFSAYQWHRE